MVSSVAFISKPIETTALYNNLFQERTYDRYAYEHHDIMRKETRVYLLECVLHGKLRRGAMNDFSPSIFSNMSDSGKKYSTFKFDFRGEQPG